NSLYRSNVSKLSEIAACKNSQCPSVRFWTIAFNTSPSGGYSNANPLTFKPANFLLDATKGNGRGIVVSKLLSNSKSASTLAGNRFLEKNLPSHFVASSRYGGTFFTGLDPGL